MVAKSLFRFFSPQFVGVDFQVGPNLDFHVGVQVGTNLDFQVGVSFLVYLKITSLSKVDFNGEASPRKTTSRPARVRIDYRRKDPPAGPYWRQIYGKIDRATVFKTTTRLPRPGFVMDSPNDVTDDPEQFRFLHLSWGLSAETRLCHGLPH